jgi:hypothetical protein
LNACSGDRAPVVPERFAAPAGEAISGTSSLGPVTAEVRLRPGEPRVGDRLGLDLEITAPERFAIELPDLDRALDRFIVLDVETRGRDGERAALRRYHIQADRSGRIRIPGLRIEVTDPDRGGEARELLTEEIPFTVAPVLAEDAAAALRPGPGRLSVSPPPLYLRWYVWAIAAIPVVAIALVAARRWRRRRRALARLDAYERALSRLRELAAAGLPEPDELDAWYVELSSVVRHYLEDRFALRAPELTTEEFLREARRAAALSDEHQGLLGEFLAGCDRVKFAQHKPEPAEQETALAEALRFVEQTRPSSPPSGSPSRSPSRSIDGEAA